MDILYRHIYLVNFDPSIGREYKRVRPGLVIQANEVTTRSPLVTIMPIRLIALFSSILYSILITFGVTPLNCGIHAPTSA